MKKTLGIFLLLAAIFLITGVIEPRFLRVGNLTNMARWTGLYGILAIGAGFVIITSGIDLSIGSLIGLTGSLFPLFLVGKGLPIGVGFALVILLALAIGFAHGVLITKLKLQPFIVTLCGLFIYRGVARYITGEINQGFGNDFQGLRLIVKYRVFDVIPMPFVIVLLLGVSPRSFSTKRYTDATCWRWGETRKRRVSAASIRIGWSSAPI